MALLGRFTNTFCSGQISETFARSSGIVYRLLDNAKIFRDWYYFGKGEGVARPTMNNIQIAFPSGFSIQSWYYLIIRNLVEALEVCWEEEMSDEDLTRKLAPR